MTRYQNTFEGLADETAITAANTGGISGDAYSAVTVAGGTLVVDDARAAHGTKSLRATPGSNAINSVTYTFPGSNRLAQRGYFYFTAAPASGMLLLYAGVGNTRVVSVELRPNFKLRLNDGSSATATNYTSTANFPVNQWVRVETDITVGTTTSNGRIRVAMYTLDSTTPIETVFDSSTLNTGTVPLTSGRMGAYSPTTDTTSFWIDSVGMDDAATGFMGVYAAALDTPIVTLGATTHPASSGGTGTQVVSWSAISNAVAYDAYIANTSTPAQGDFALVASGVTSPYTFTNVSSGSHAYGIKAKAS